jgi:hypothetical protein
VQKLLLYLALPAVFGAGMWAAVALARTTPISGVTTLRHAKPGAEAVALGKTACSDMRARVGRARFVSTFKTAHACYAVMAVAAQDGIDLCKKRYPPGSTADLYCIELAIESSPVQRAVVAGLPITTGKRVTTVPIPTAGPGAGTGLGTGAGTGGGIPGSHQH